MPLSIPGFPPPRRHRHRGHHPDFARVLAGICLAALAITLPSAVGPAHAAAAALAPAAASGMARCTPTPVASITDLPWAQQYYDLTALAPPPGATGTTVAVIDSGVDASHPQLRDAVRPGADMLARGGDGREDCVGHGTAVASVIAARPIAGVPFHGVAPGVSILPVRVSERTDVDGAIPGQGDIGDLAAGIRAAVTSQPRPAVINLSISTMADNPEVRMAVEQALAADIVVVAAVGNHHERGDPTPYPAAYDGVLGVGAIGPDGLRLTESQVGSYVDIVAPGDRIVAAAPGGGHLTFEGTSLAVPFVAATAALIRARYPSLGQADVVHRLLATADPAPGSRPSMEYGYGVLNPTRALTEVLVPRILGAASPAPLPGGSAEAGAAPTPAISTTLLAASVLVTAAMVILATAAALPLGRRRRWRPGVVADLPTLLGPPPPPSEPSAPAVPRQRRGHAPTPTAREPDRRGSPISR